ncbi:MAG: alkaline phosphatase [Chitinophagales bacterium]|nr:alkaline phosphatase [Chitinophagales bacterium]
MFLRILLLWASCFSLAAHANPDSTTVAYTKPKNIILMIGDGMGLTQVSAAIVSTATPLAFERFKHIGFIKTRSGNKLITDSAAGATAFACGVKTYNGAIGVGLDTLPKETIMETAKKKGLSTGLLVTCTITHATPACFYAHVKTRADDESIASDLLKADVDIFVGGGQPYFEQRKDGRNLMREFDKIGYTITTSLDALIQSDAKKLGMIYPDTNLPSMLKGRGDYLPKAVEPVISRLSDNKKGFFLMIEGSQIDWGGHANNSDYIITEVLDFDKAIAKVLDFAEKDGNTLVVVTADHETGGYAIDAEDKNPNQLKGIFSTGHHTGTLVPVYAFGPGAELFQGIYDNTDIYKKMMELMGW